MSDNVGSDNTGGDNTGGDESAGAFKKAIEKGTKHREIL